MKYTSEIIVDLPLNEFISKFENAENMKHWQKGLISIEHLSGIPGMVGSKMKLQYKLDHRNMEIIETISHGNLPKEYHVTYSTKGIDNLQENYFEEINNGRTKWISKSEFLPLKFSMGFLLWLMPGTFKKQSKQFMRDFKNFAENDISIKNAKTKTYLGF